jgi:eukaryotic-like serine/threonine-protein kinase
VVGYECLAGHRPFLSENAVTVAMMHIRDAPPPLPPDVPPYARVVIEATLVKDPTQRYASGGEFAAAVAAVRAGHPLPAPSGRVAAGHYMGPPGATNPGMLPVGPPSAPHTLHPNAHTGSFPLGPPRPPRRNRAGLWALLIVLGVVLLVLAVLGVASLLNADRETDGESTPETTSAPAGSADTGEDGTDDPGNPPRTGIPQGKFVQVDESVYLGRPAGLANDLLEEDGLVPVVENQFGEQPNDFGRCMVVEVTPDGRQQVGTEVLVRCEEDEEPPR